MRRYLMIAMLAVLAALWTGSAAAVPPERVVTFENTYSFSGAQANPELCGDASFVVHDNCGNQAQFGKLAAQSLAQVARVQKPIRNQRGHTNHLNLFFAGFLESFRCQ